MAEKVIPAASYAASTGSVVLGLTADEWSIIAILVGIATGLATFALNAWFQWDRRQREIMAAGGGK